MQTDTPVFIVLDEVDSTNNYAMQRIHAGLAKHGDRVFTSHQTQGKGQRGKSWTTQKGQNLALSIILKHDALEIGHQFMLSAYMALTCREFISTGIGENISIKWPNDIYWNDRKAGGILIENQIRGTKWLYSVVGIGLNINQADFNPSLPNPVSWAQITGKRFDVEDLARQLGERVMGGFDQLKQAEFVTLLNRYNLHLYKRNEQVILKKQTECFETTILGVNESGQMLIDNEACPVVNFGEMEWVMTEGKC